MLRTNTLKDYLDRSIAKMQEAIFIEDYSLDKRTPIPSRLLTEENHESIVQTLLTCFYKIYNQQACIKALEDKIRRLKIEVEHKNDTISLYTKYHRIALDKGLDFKKEANAYKNYLPIVSDAFKLEKDENTKLTEEVVNLRTRVRDLVEKDLEMGSHTKAQAEIISNQAVELNEVYKNNQELERLFHEQIEQIAELTGIINRHDARTKELVNIIAEKTTQNLDLKLQLNNCKQSDPIKTSNSGQQVGC